MKRAAVPFALVLALAGAGTWGVLRALAPAWPSDPAPPPATEAPEPRVITGSLGSTASTAVAELAGTSPLVLVVLRASDWFTCEDLGRQLRDLQYRNRSLTYVIATDSVDRTRSFARRERLRWPVITLAPRDVLHGYPALPTPAVLAVRDNGRRVDGVAHPERVPNARVRSFADELAGVLP